MGREQICPSSNSLDVDDGNAFLQSTYDDFALSRKAVVTSSRFYVSLILYGGRRFKRGRHGAILSELIYGSINPFRLEAFFLHSSI